MAAATLRHEERLGLGIAVAAHLALVAWLVLGMRNPAPLPPPERTEVTLTDDAALTSTAPEPATLAPAPQVAPELGPAEPQAMPQPLTPLPPQPAPLAPSAQRPAPQVAKPAALPPRGSRIGSDFLKGFNAPAQGAAKTPPAAAIGPAVRSSLAGAISRQLKPRWTAPQGVDAELLVTVLAWDMNPDGSLAGAPRVVRQEGITAANRAQASRHAEQAIRAVRLAAPFDLPHEFYAAWQHVASFRFDRRLSQ